MEMKVTWYLVVRTKARVKDLTQHHHQSTDLMLSRERGGRVYRKLFGFRIKLGRRRVCDRHEFKIGRFCL
eukprot:14885961-Ditylum_brightwellii.AAC.2